MNTTTESAAPPSVLPQILRPSRRPSLPPHLADPYQDVTPFETTTVTPDAVAPSDDPTWGEWADDPGLKIAVLLPCRNEQSTIGAVVRDFRMALPSATVYVYDNASTDLTAQAAEEAGAIVRRVPTPGKGNVLRRMFAEVDATVYVLADGDDTYDAFAAPELIRRLRRHHLDMVIGRRVEDAEAVEAYRPGHRLGNALLTKSVQWLFGYGTDDMLSGYRVFSRRYIKSFPAFSRGFETETEMTVHALELCLPFEEMPTAYRDRPDASVSKLQTIPDGIRILKFIALLCKDYRPLRFFGFLALVCSCLALGVDLSFGMGTHGWTASKVLISGSSALAAVFVFAAVILDSTNRSRREMKRMLYLAIPAFGWPEDESDPACGCGHRVV